MGKPGSCPHVSSEYTHADPLHKRSYLILLVHGYIFVPFFIKLPNVMGKSASCPDVSSECTQAGPLHKLSYLILLVHGYILYYFS